MRAPLLAAAALSSVVFGAASVAAGTGYTVSITQPGSIAGGGILVRATVSGPGIGDTERGAFHVRAPGGSWSQGSSVAMGPTGSSSFTSTQIWDTGAMANGVYELEVRIWGDVPPYRPDDRATYSRATAEVRIDNAPPAPEGLSVTTDPGGASLQWAAVPFADRSDFLGYRIWALPQEPCPAALADYRDIGSVTETAVSLRGLAPGPWCFRVTAERKSVVSDRLASAPSGAVGGKVAAPSGGSAGPGAGAGSGRGKGGGKGGSNDGSSSVPPGGWVTGAAEIADPPAAPALGPGVPDRDVPPADLGSYEDDLPYGPVTVTELADGGGAPREAGGVFGSLDARDRARAFGAGLLLAVLALHLRIFLGRGVAAAPATRAITRGRGRGPRPPRRRSRDGSAPRSPRL